MTEHALRPATPDDAAAIAEVQVAAWQTAYAGILPAALIEAMRVPDRTRAWQRILASFEEGGQGVALVAGDGGGMTGFATMGPQRDDALADQGFTGEITSIYLLGRARRQGLGSALMRGLAGEFATRGHRGAALWVIAGNRVACDFYAALGGEIVAERADPEHGYDEIAYGWRDVAVLAG